PDGRAGDTAGPRADAGDGRARDQPRLRSEHLDAHPGGGLPDGHLTGLGPYGRAGRVPHPQGTREGPGHRRTHRGLGTCALGSRARGARVPVASWWPQRRRRAVRPRGTTAPRAGTPTGSSGQRRRALLGHRLLRELSRVHLWWGVLPSGRCFWVNSRGGGVPTRTALGQAGQASLPSISSGSSPLVIHLAAPRVAKVRANATTAPLTAAKTTSSPMLTSSSSSPVGGA